MPSIEEKRVHVDRADTVAAYVAADLGVAVARVSGDTVGEFALVHRTPARDVAATALGVAAATDDDVLLADVDAGAPDGNADAPAESGDDALEPTGFGPAVAVTDHAGGVLAADADGHLGLFDGDDWTTLGTVPGEVRALDDDLVAADDGVHRVTADGVEPAGLLDARDVTAVGVPHAATAGGLYRLGNGWLDVREGDFHVVAADPGTAEVGALGRAHAATPDALLAHDAGEWTDCDLPVDEPVADVAYAPDGPIALTESGTLAVDAGSGFRHRNLGLQDARAVCVVATEDE